MKFSADAFSASRSILPVSVKRWRIALDPLTLFWPVADWETSHGAKTYWLVSMNEEKRAEPAVVGHSVDELAPAKPHREYIDARVKDIEGAASRSRFLFGFNVALSWLLIAMAYNSTWSWMRTMAEVSEGDVLPRGSARLVRHTLQESLFSGWTGSLYFEVPFLGARFSASDAGITGGLLLLIVSVWCFYAARRENHLIFHLVRDSERYRFTVQMRRYLRNQLHATQVFAGTGENEALHDHHLSGDAPVRKQLTMKVLAGAMYASAPIALAFVLFTDIYSLRLDSPFREGGKLYEAFWNPCFVPSGDTPRKCWPAAELGIRLFASCVFLVLCTVVMYRGHKFQQATQRLLGHLDKRQARAAIPPQDC